MKVGERIIVAEHSLMLTATIEERNGDLVCIRVENPWGNPLPFSEWHKIADLENNLRSADRVSSW